jgi:molybdate transport system substrate-binding protein
LRLATSIALFFFLGAAKGAPLTIAVASNFLPTAEKITADFTAETSIEVRISSGSTGKLHTQILHGAPYDVFLAADDRSPRMLEESGQGIAGSRFEYARGVLVLWSIAQQASCSFHFHDLGDARLAIANPTTAPYGRAAKEFLELTGGWEKISAQVVYGENVAQALHFAATANARYAIVAKSQSLDPNLPEASCSRHIPEETYMPLKQEALLLRRAKDDPDALAFLQYLQSDAARDTIRSMGYGVP